jgi:hypothetical protein
MSRLTVGSIEGLTENSNVISVPTGHKLNVTDAAGLQIGGSAVVSAGLVHISRTTIGTAVSSVTVSDAFSSTYDNYRLIVRGVVPSTNTGLVIQFGAVTTGYTWAAWLANYAGSGSGSGSSSATYTRIGAIDPNNIGGMSVDIYGPNLANKTVVTSLGLYGATGTTGGLYSVAGLETGSSQHTAFTLSPTAGTLTGGTIDVYGYVKS